MKRDPRPGFLLLLCLAGSASAAIPETERQALIDLYNSTNGPGWTEQARWLGAPGTECSWSGVTCDPGQTTVLGLARQGVNLAGTIPPTLSRLASLETLVLRNNKLTGGIPKELGGLARLQTLNLSINGLSGAIPVEIGNLTSLVNLVLGRNQLSGALPSELSRLTKLKEIYLGGNQLSGPIPAWLGALGELTVLNLWGNRFTGPIPPELGNLKNLTSLELEDNALSGVLPASLGQLTALQWLWVANNQLSGELPDLSRLTKLEEIDITGNPGMSGPIPPWLGQMPALTWLNMRDSKRTGDLPDLSACTKMQYLYLNDNPGLSAGPVPPWLSSMTNLLVLNLSFTNRTGNLPDMSGAKKLQSLDLGGNTRMGPGPIPAWLSGLSTLVAVELFNTNRTGDIPDLSAATGLQSLDLSDNPGMSSGPIPAWLSGRSGLVRLGLGNTNRTGPIPDLASSANMTSLNLGPNPSLTPGLIPSWVTNLRALTSLSFWNTNRTGEIPNLSGLSKLDSLVLKDNPGLTPGPIPPWIAQLPALNVLLVGGTNRTGAIPDLSRLPLVALDLDNNPGLDAGPIPDWIPRQTGLFFLGLRNSNRQGLIPEGIGMLTGLMSLDLASNRLTGEIPATFKNLTKLGVNDDPFLLIPPELLYFDLRWNALHSSDPALVSFLDGKQTGGDWRGTQTVAPGNVSARAEGPSSVRVSWTPIAYTADPGYYEVQALRGGSWTPVGQTPSKSASSFLLTGQGAGASLTLAVVSVTSAHANNPSRVTSERSASVTATVGCPTLSAPVFTSVPGAPVTAGGSFTVAWTPIAAGYLDGGYRVDVSMSESCAEPVRLITAQPSLTVATEAGRSRTYCFQVVATAGQGCDGPASMPAKVSVEVSPAFFTVLASAAPVTMNRNDAVPSNLYVVLRNAGGAPASLVLTGVPGLFTPVPGSVPSVSPGQDVTIQLQFDGAASATTGLKSGNLLAAWGSGSLTSPVLLNVVEKPAEPSEGSKLSYEGTNDIHFRHTGEGNPEPQSITIMNTGSEPVSVAPKIGPGGGWLSVTGDFSTPIAPGGRRQFQLSVDRKKRVEADGPPPLVTNLVFLNLGGKDADSAYGQVFDEEPPPPAPGSARPALGEYDFSLILGSAVSAQGRGARFVSEAWIENRGSSSATAELYYTPDGVDGLSGDSVTKSKVTLAAYTTYRLSDFVDGIFSKAGSGQVELRSTALPQLAIRSTADAITTKETGIARYGSEIPLVLSRQGVRAGFVSLICGLRDATTGFRTNVILAETSGKRATVRLRLYDGDGKLIGQKLLEIGPYSKIQVNSTDESFFAPGRSYEGGTIEMVSESGAGSVAGFATVIDNASGSYATRAAEVFAVSAAAAPVSKRAAPLASSPLFLPAATRSEALNNSFYTTRLVMANLGRSAVKLTLTYLPDVGLGDPVTREVTLPARAEGPRSWSRDDVLGTLFGIQQNSSGMIRFDGDLGAVSVASETSTPLDLGDPGKGRSVSAFNPAPGKPETESYGLYSREANEVIGTAASGSGRSVVFHPAIEEGFAFRTNLILAELAGDAAEVRVRIIRSGLAGAALGEKTYTLAPYQRLQRNKVVREVLGRAGDDLGVEFKDVEIEVQAVSGKGRVLALVTKIDNNPASKRADIFTLGGAVGGPSSPVGTGN